MEQASRWDSLVWPQWLPVRARLPIVAQITGAVALTALIVGPWWAGIPGTTVLESAPIAQSSVVPHAPAVAPSKPMIRFDGPPGSSTRPAHLNLDVHHTFGSMDLSVTVDDKPALTSTLDGGGKRFKMFGKRAGRGFTQTIDLAPGVRVVRVRLTSTADKFDQTRVERFDLGSAAVAAIRIDADKSGMTLAADHPAPPATPKAAPASVQAAPPAAVPAAGPASVATAAQVSSQAPQEASTVIELVQSLRSMLIAIAGFVASAATGFLVQEFLRRRRGLIFDKPVKRRPAGFT